MRPRVRIESDGNPSGSRVWLVNDDGSQTEIPNVTRASWVLDCAEGPARVMLEVICAGVEVDGRLDRLNVEDLRSLLAKERDLAGLPILEEPPAGDPDSAAFSQIVRRILPRLLRR